MSIASFITVAIGLCWLIANAIQIKHLIKRKSSHDVSLWFLGLGMSGVTLTLLLTYLTPNHILVIIQQWVNVIAFGTVTGTVLYYRRSGWSRLTCRIIGRDRNGDTVIDEFDRGNMTITLSREDLNKMAEMEKDLPCSVGGLAVDLGMHRKIDEINSVD